MYFELLEISNLTKVGDKVISIDNMVPISYIYEYIYSMSLFVNDGEYAQIIKDYKMQQVGEPKCDIDVDSPSSSGQEIVQLSIENIILGLLATCC